MRYTLKQIEYFIAAAETGSITIASERMNISQPSISTAITHLERELDTKLFVRHHAKGLSLTPAGRELLSVAKKLIDQAQQIYTVVSEVGEKIRGQLSLGALTTFAPMIMPELTHSFTSAFPATRIVPMVSHHEHLLDMLSRAELDVALSYDLMVPEDFEFLPLATLPLQAVFSASHPFARRSSITLEELAKEPLILLDLPLSREYMLDAFSARNLQPAISARSRHLEVIRTMVANGYGYTLASIRPKSEVAMDGRPLKRVPIVGNPKPLRLGVITYRQLDSSRLVTAFKSHCRTYISDAYVPGMEPPMMERRRVDAPATLT